MTCYLAESHYQLKEYDEAEKIYDKLINNDSKNAQYYILKGECLAKSGDAKAAVKVYEQGWNHTQDTQIFWRKSVRYSVEQKDYDNALKYVQKGIEQGGESKVRFYVWKDLSSMKKQRRMIRHTRQRKNM
ncbi:MAG: tetratricopeptide repeat protein [Anaerobutyricum soehngenii]